MRNSFPKQMAIYLGILVSIISSIILYLSYTADITHQLLFIFLMILIEFLLVYLVVFYSLNNFIINKIKPIYKTIRNINVSDKEIYKAIENRDIISEVNSQVLSWAIKEKQQLQELKQQSKYRKEFLGNVSHELKTPIFNIQGYILTLLDGGLEDPSVNRHYLERTEKNINRIISIVDDLTIISKLESGEVELEFETFDIVKMIEDVFEMYEIKAKKRGIDLKFAPAAMKIVFVKADKKGMSQVISNLIENSIKYGKEKGQTIVDFYDMDKNILIEITDDGIGIDEAFLPRIFERFYRVDKHRSREQGGTGLGLSIVKHIIDAHKQSLNVRSQIGRGTSFTFTLRKTNI